MTLRRSLISFLALLAFTGVLLGQTATVKTYADDDGTVTPDGYYNLTASTYIGIGGLRITVAGFNDGQDYSVQWKLVGGSFSTFSGSIGTASGTGFTIDITNAMINSDIGPSFGTRFIIQVIDDIYGNVDGPNTVIATADGGGYGGQEDFFYDITVPTVSYVTSSAGNGTKIIGNTITINSVFTEAVTVVTASGTPTLGLNSGATVNYSSGTGTTSLDFSYTIASGQSSTDLDYTSINALATNGGTIRDAAGNDANLTLATPSTGNSLGNNKDIVIDGIRPYVTGVSSTTANGSYKEGDNISIKITFQEAVVVNTGGGTPTLTLNPGGPYSINYSSTSPDGTELTFTYTVQATHTSADLDYNSTNALVLNGGTINDPNGNTATLTLASPGGGGSLGSNAALIIDTTVPTVTDVTSSTTNGTYKAGNTIVLEVTFSEAVTVTGTPQITMDTGTPAIVNYSSGSGSTILVFNYIIGSGENSTDLAYINTSALALNGGAIRDAALNDATLTLQAPGDANSLSGNKELVVDTTPPTVTNVTSSAPNGTNAIGDLIPIQITFDEVVTVTGTPSLNLDVGTIYPVSYITGSGTNTLTFNYTVQDGHVSADLDYESTSALSGTIQDAAGNDATQTLATPSAATSIGANKNIIIDGVRPVVTEVTTTSASGSYNAGDIIPITVTFDDAVTVTGFPELTLDLGAGYVVTYTSGSGSTDLLFNYTVLGSHTTTDLAYVSTASLALSGGTVNDANGNAATLTLPTVGGISSLSGPKDIVIDNTAPTVTAVTSTDPNDSYMTGDGITITVTFDEAIVVTGTPLLNLNSGGQASYTGGDGTTVLTFLYTIAGGEDVADLDYAATTSLTAGTSLQDAAGNDADRTLALPGTSGSLGDAKNIVIDTIQPTVTAITSTTADGSYKAGSTIEITATFDEAVYVTAPNPTITLAVASGATAVTYTGGTGTTTLTFDYVVAAGDGSLDLAYAATNSLTTAGTLLDLAGNAAVLTLANPGDPNSLSNAKAIIIDTTDPTVTDVTASTVTDGFYIVGSIIPIEITFSEIVNVTGTPQIILETGVAGDEVVNYTSGTGTTTLTFNYTVVAGNITSDLDYISTTALGLNLGTIRDAALNNADLTLAAPGAANSLGSNKAIVIDAEDPTVLRVSSTASNGMYIAGDVIPITVDFSEAVTVSGTPTIALDVDGGYVVSYSSGSGDTTLVFNYTVFSGHNATDLDYTATTALLDGGGTIRDAAANDADLTLAAPSAVGSLRANKDLVIDTVIPTVVSVTSTATDGAYKEGDVLPITITFTEEIVVALANPLLALETGAVNTDAVYASGSGTTVLTFNYTVVANDTASDLEYAATTALIVNGATVTDSAGNAATLTLPTLGGAQSLGGSKDLLIDTILPTVLSVVSYTADGHFKVGDAISIAVAFSENVTVTGTPQLTLETGTTDAIVDYASGTGTDTLFFTYTVAANESSSDLNYTATTSLALNAGTILDQALNAATLTLPAVAAANALAGAARLVIDTQLPTAALTYSDTLVSAAEEVTVTVTLSEPALATPTISIAYAANLNNISNAPMTATGSTTVWTYDATIPTGNDGYATATVVMSDSAGNALAADSTSGKSDLKLDNTPPVYTVSFNDSLVRAGESIIITASFSEPVQATPTIDVNYSGTTDDVTAGSMSQVIVGNDSLWSFGPIATPTANDGYVAIAITAIDAVNRAATAGTGATNTLLVDNTAPSITVTAPTSNSYRRVVDVAYTLSETVDSASFKWTPTSTDVVDTRSPQVIELTGSELTVNNHSGVLTNFTSLVQGVDYTIDFMIYDAAGNGDTATVVQMAYDTLAPDISAGFIYDSLATADVDSTLSRNTFTGRWGRITDAVSDIQFYEYAIGTTRGDTNVVGWTSNTTDTTFQVTGLTLALKGWYYFMVRATDLAGNQSDSLVSDGVRVISKAALTAAVLQNSALLSYLDIFVSDSIGMINTLTLTAAGTALTPTKIDSFTWVASHKLTAAGLISIVATSSSAAGDTSVTDTLTAALAKRDAGWLVTSHDGQFQAQGMPGSMTRDGFLAVMDASLIPDHGVDGALYQFAATGVEFGKPVKVSMLPPAGSLAKGGAGAIYQLTREGIWEELPTMDEDRAVVAWVSNGGQFKIGKRTRVLPRTTGLSQNYPNPFNPTTRIVFDLGYEDGPAQKASLVIYNILGQEVVTLHNSVSAPGRYELTWNSVDKRGVQVASGVYFARLTTGTGKKMIKKMLLVR